MNIFTIKMVMMHTLTYAVLDYIDNLPVLILNDDICMHTCFQTLTQCGVFFAKLQGSCKNSAIHRWRLHSVEKTLLYRIESYKYGFPSTCFIYDNSNNYF